MFKLLIISLIQWFTQVNLKSGQFAVKDLVIILVKDNLHGLPCLLCLIMLNFRMINMVNQK